MNYENKTNGANGKVGNRGVSRGTAIAGRGSSKILQRSNIISNNNGTPNLKANNKAKAAQVLSGQPAVDEGSKFPYGNTNEKDLDIFGNKREANQVLGPMSKYNNKSKSMIGNKAGELNYENNSSMQMEMNMELMEEMQ